MLTGKEPVVSADDVCDTCRHVERCARRLAIAEELADICVPIATVMRCGDYEEMLP